MRDRMLRSPLVLGGQVFPTRKAARDAARRILHYYWPGEIVRDQAHHQFHVDLVYLHSSGVEKIGVGISHFEVRHNLFSTTGFWLVRTDGTATDFSYLKCISPPTHRAQVTAALRRAIDDQILEFRNQALSEGPVLCPVYNIPLTTNNSEVDHAAPLTFKRLSELLVDMFGGWDAIELQPERDGVLGDKLADWKVEWQWQDFHMARANLRLVSRAANQGPLRIREPRRG